MSTRTKNEKLKKKDIDAIINIINSSNVSNTPSKSDSSFLDSINFSELFNPNDKFRNIGDKTSFDLSKYNLGIFNSLSSICKNLNISYENKFNKEVDKSNKLDLQKENNNNENIINESDNKENIFSDSIIKILLSEENSTKIKKEKSNLNKNSIKKIKNSGIKLSDAEIDELLKGYFPMEIEKNDLAK